MKTIKLIISLGLILMFSMGLNAQKFEKDVSGVKNILITSLSPDLQIKGVSGSTLTIKAAGFEKPPAKAEGLTQINGYDREDNTEIGLNVTKDGQDLKIFAAKKEAEDADYEILIPKDMNVKILYDHWMSEDVYVEGMSGEVDIKTLNGEVELKEVTGPVVVHAMNGDVICDFVSVNQQSPTSITAVNGDIDIHLPGNTPADISIKTINGAVYSNIDIEVPKNDDEEESMMHIGGSKVVGKINGGGVSITLNAINNNIYLRKK